MFYSSTETDAIRRKPFLIRWLFLRLLGIIAFTLPLHPATYYVAKDGNDGNQGTANAPWLTISKAAAVAEAGDTVTIGDGDYDEHVQESSSGSPGNFITFKAERPGGVSLRAFRLLGGFIKIDGLMMNRYSGVNNSWGAAIRIDPTANSCVVTNCRVMDAPYVISHDFSFDHLENRIISPSSDFIAAGFTEGSRIYLGASGLNGLWYTNHNTTWIVSELTRTSLWVTNTSGTPMQPDPGSNYWAAVHAGTGSGGYNAVAFVISNGISATNVLVSNNAISNWFGHAIDLKGKGNIVEKNAITKLNSFRFLSFMGDNHVIRSNVVRNSPNILSYSVHELATIPHPAGADWYDYQVGMLSGFTTTLSKNTNVLIQGNWFQNIENQLGRVDDEKPDTYDITYVGNVFIGVSAHFSGGRDGMRWISNTFYRCSFESANHPLSIGGRAPQQSAYVITHNLFIDCGGYAGYQTRGWYTISDNAITPLADYNCVASAEITGFAPKKGFSEVNGVNGGDPVFLSVLDFDGPDEVPFTADDGLKVLPNSPAAAVSAGALGVFELKSNEPIAHFRITDPQGWFEPTGASYNPAWVAQSPTSRGGPLRPFDTPHGLGVIPVTVTFSAESSISAVDGSTSNAGITSYYWDYGDGTVVTTVSPVATHTFKTAGKRLIQLTVKNSFGNTHTTSNLFRVFANGTLAPSQPQGFRIN